MLEVVSSLVALITGLLSALFGIVVLVAVQCSEILYHFHMSMPRLEGLVVGVLLTWLLLRRERHPVLRVLSSPLKLILDILDLAWDQVVEVATDLKQASLGLLVSLKDRVASMTRGVYSKLVEGLKLVKAKLTPKKE